MRILEEREGVAFPRLIPTQSLELGELLAKLVNLLHLGKALEQLLEDDDIKRSKAIKKKKKRRR